MEVNKGGFFYYNANTTAHSKLRFRSSLSPPTGSGAKSGNSLAKKHREKLAVSHQRSGSPSRKEELDVESETSMAAVDASRPPGSLIEGLETFNAARVFRLTPQQQRKPFCPDSVFVQQKPNIQIAACKKPPQRPQNGNVVVSWGGLGAPPGSKGSTGVQQPQQLQAFSTPGAQALCDGCRCIVSLLHPEAMSRQRVVEEEQESRILLHAFIQSQVIVPKPLRGILGDLSSSSEKAQAIGAWQQQKAMNSPLRHRREYNAREELDRIERSIASPNSFESTPLRMPSSSSQGQSFEATNPEPGVATSKRLDMMTTPPQEDTSHKDEDYDVALGRQGSVVAGPWGSATEEEFAGAAENDTGAAEDFAPSATTDQNAMPQPSASVMLQNDRPSSPLMQESSVSSVAKPRAIDRLRSVVI